MATASPISASRFDLTVDGYEVGAFSELLTATTPGGPVRNVQPHELAHVMQQRATAKGVNWPPLILKTGVLQQSALWRLQSVTARSRVSVGTSDAAMKLGSTVQLQGTKVVRYSTPMAKGGGEVSVQELVLATEG